MHPSVGDDGASVSRVEPAPTAFALAAVLHAGFQTTVTALVYPALVRAGLDHPAEWRLVHHRHSRAIVGLVGVVYVLLLVTGVWLLTSGPSPWSLLALGASWGAVLVTAVAAAPTHGRLTSPDPLLLRRLVVVDRWRAALALVGALGAVAALMSGATHVQG